METMTKRELNLRIFEGKEAADVLFQPRISHWYNWHKMRGTLPEKYREITMLEVYEDLGISPRYFPETTGLGAREVKYAKEVKIEEKVEEKKRFIITTTPKGELIREEKQSSVEGSWRITKYPIKNAEDIEKAIWLFENTTYSFIKENFEKGSRFFADRGEPQFYVPRSGYQHLALYEMGLENLIYGLADFPEKIERLMRAIDNSYDSLYEEIVSYGKAKIINFGENIDGNIVSPAHFEKYCIPFYEKRVSQLKKSGIYTHIHIDGSFRPLLKYLKDLPFDGLEALTPLPQGDVTIEEMKEAIGDKVLLDGIPAILFLPNYPIEELQECVGKLVKLFHPRLILGASDEVPPPADIERVRYLSQYCQKCQNEN